jgi:aminobenzoyl-glutamate utilization protein B
VKKNPVAATAGGRGWQPEKAAGLIEGFVEEQAAFHDAICRDIWEHPEPAFQEERSSALYRNRLAAQGFCLTEFPEMKHSFVAERSCGGAAAAEGAAAAGGAAAVVPVIGFMGEYDALPGMSQTCSVSREPAVAGAPGHACGHNLLGAGSLVAVESLARTLDALGVPAILRYYGCPAEESLGRIPMVKAGRFDDCDAVMTWHPADVNTPHRYVTNANLSVVFSYKGRASHAGMAPQTGRSALDAVQLFNLSLEFMREHLGPGILLHYVITDGGSRPNIVPESAATFLYVRAPLASMVRVVMKRILKAAKGAALMTETGFSYEIKHGKCDYRPNESIQDAMKRAMDLMPMPVPTPEELEFARSLQATVQKSDLRATLDPIGAPASLLKSPLHLAVGDFGAGKRIGGSLDTGDVSYVAPVGQLNAATWPLGVGAHTWQSCAASGSSWAFKAMRWAGACMALAGAEFASLPEFRRRVAAEFRASRLPYRSTMDL